MFSVCPYVIFFSPFLCNCQHSCLFFGVLILDMKHFCVELHWGIFMARNLQNTERFKKVLFNFVLKNHL